MRGIIANIYRSSDGDVSNCGISSRVNRVTVIGLDGGEVFDATADAPAVKIVEDVIFGQRRLRAVPLECGKRWTMFGGCFIFTCDSRLSSVSPYPIPLHDRME